jgi:hypothetical protein
MALKINGVTGTYTVMRLNKPYRNTAFEPTLKLRVTTDGGSQEKSFDVKMILEQAWKQVERKADLKPCNEYFKTLFQKKTLKQILVEADITLHCLEPKDGHTYAEVPDANTAGRDIGINPSLFLDKDASALACVLVHELAHVGGATTNAIAPDAHAAELALNSCMCTKYYDKDIVGRIERIGSGPDVRYV